MKGLQQDLLGQCLLMMSGIHDMASRMKAAGPDHTPSAADAECRPCRVCRAACKQLPSLQQLVKGSGPLRRGGDEEEAGIPFNQPLLDLACIGILHKR